MSNKKSFSLTNATPAILLSGGPLVQNYLGFNAIIAEENQNTYTVLARNLTSVHAFILPKSCVLPLIGYKPKFEDFYFE